MKPGPWFPVGAAAVIGVVALPALHTGGVLLHVPWMLSLLWLLPAVLVAAYWVSPRDLPAAWLRTDTTGDRPALVLLGAVLLFLFSGSAGQESFFFLDWVSSGARLRSGISLFFVGVAATIVLLSALRRWNAARWLWGILLLALVVSLWRLMSETGGRALYRDDHTSFLYRFWIFGRTFPRLVYYNPFWNGGRAATYLISSGVASLGIPFWPLWRWCNPSLVYTPLIGTAFIILVPLLAAASLRLMRASWTAAACAGLLALATCRLFFVHLLHFGTVGSLFAMAFLMPVMAALYRVLFLKGRGWWLAFILVGSAVLLFTWPGSVFVAGPVLATGLVSVNRVERRTLRYLALCAVVAAVCVAPFVMGVLLHSDYRAFSSMEEVRATGWADSFRAGIDVLRVNLAGAHPILLFLGLGGVLFLPDRRVRRWCLPPLVLFGLLAGWGNQWKPQFQLDRMLIPMLLVAIVPASLWVARLLDGEARRMIPARALLLALLVSGAWTASRIYGNQSAASYRTVSQPMRGLVAWIRANTPADGRILFAGPTVHGYGGAHVAVLSLWTERDMMACDYYAFSPRKVAYDFPPREWRDGGHAELAQYLDLYNVTHVVTYHENWKKVFRKRPGHYEEVASFMQRTLRICVFRVNRPSSMFLAGSGRIEAGINCLRVSVDDSAIESVLKYNWVDGLSALPPAELHPVDAGGGVRFIGLRPNGEKECRIRY